MSKPIFTTIDSNNNPTLTRDEVFNNSFKALLDDSVRGSGKIDMNELLDKTFTSNQISGTGSAITFNVAGSKANDLLYNPATKCLYMCTAQNTWKYLMCMKDPLPSGFSTYSWELYWPDDYDESLSPTTGFRELFRNNAATLTQLNSINTNSDFRLEIDPSESPYILSMIFPNSYNKIMWNYSLSFKWRSKIPSMIQQYLHVYFTDATNEVAPVDLGGYSLIYNGQMNGFGYFDKSDQNSSNKVLPKYFRMSYDATEFPEGELTYAILRFDLVVNWWVLE